MRLAVSWRPFESLVQEFRSCKKELILVFAIVLSAALVIFSIWIHLSCLRSLLGLLPQIARFRRSRVGLTVLGALLGHMNEIAVFGTVFFLLAASERFGTVARAGERSLTWEGSPIILPLPILPSVTAI